MTVEIPGAAALVGTRDIQWKDGEARAWERNDAALIFPFECDPDSFFRQLFTEGRMQEYIDRAHMRP